METPMTTAENFHALHKGPQILILPNAWDAMSAKLVEGAGAKAIATSSAAVAWSHGYADGHKLPFELLLRTAAAIVRVAKVPVTCDSEGGYADTPEGAAENIRRLIDVGVVGINIEDGGEPHDLHVRKVSAIRKAAQSAGVNLFVNARTDVYLKGLAPADRRKDESIRRAHALREAGASGIFVPGAAPADIPVLAKGIALPLNMMGWSGVPKAAALQEMGVRRLSAATNIARAAWAAVAKSARLYLFDGDNDALTAMGDDGADYNALFK
jgi:2-methylisocitrate lyase-like PEP mutase family enzyme